MNVWNFLFMASFAAVVAHTCALNSKRRISDLRKNAVIIAVVLSAVITMWPLDEDSEPRTQNPYKAGVQMFLTLCIGALAGVQTGYLHRNSG